MDWEIKLFGQKNIDECFTLTKNAVLGKINSQAEDYILNVDEKTFQDYIFDLLSIKTPIIDEGGITLSKEKWYDGNNYVSLLVPFQGNQSLFEYKPESSIMDYYTVSINDNNLTIRVLLTSSSSQEQIDNEVKAKLKTLKTNLDNLNHSIIKFNANLKNFIKDNFDSRKKTILNENKILASIGFPLKERADALKTYVIPEIRRVISIQKPEAQIGKFSPEPVISKDDYEHILKVIDNMSKVMEFSPSAFVNMEEEHLRFHFLVQLNGHYEGQATGETFNFGGKTDIIIKDNGTNIFIAECKFWRGEIEFTKTIDQLLNYVSWRDTKTAVILFNKNKDTSNVLSQIPDIVKKHHNFVKQENYDKEKSFRFTMKNKNDGGKTFILTVKVFDIPLIDKKQN